MPGPSPAPLQNYDPNQVYCSVVHPILGIEALSGYLEGTFVEFTRNKPTFGLKVDISGGGTRDKSNDKSGKIKIVLKQQSVSNKFLSELALLDENTGAGVVSFHLEDYNSESTIIAQSCWIMEPPKQDWGRESVGREWTFETDSSLWLISN